VLGYSGSTTTKELDGASRRVRRSRAARAYRLAGERFISERSGIHVMLTRRRQDDEKYIYFYSGPEPTYRKVADNPSAFTLIPTVSLAELDSPSLGARKRIAKSIYDACATCGFFYIENHGIPEDVIAETFDLVKRFFALDLDAKMDAFVHKNPTLRGYEPMFETTKTKGGR
jgi:hypothetical protein